MTPKEPMVADPLADPVLAALVEKAIAPYRAVLTTTQLEALRSVLGIQLASQPVLARAVAAIKPRAVPLVSGDVATTEEPETKPATLRAKKAQGSG